MSPYTLRRKAARVVVLGPAETVLLLRARDPWDPSKPPWWEIPGGGQEPWETSYEAAARELYEETGIRDARIGPCVWTQHAVFDFGGYHFDQDERVHVAWADQTHGYEPMGLEALEAVAFAGHRWWPLDELMASDVPLLPHRMREFLPDLVAGQLPEEPLDIGVRQGDGSGPVI